MSSPKLKCVTTTYGHKLFVNPNDEIGNEIIRKGIYDRAYIFLLKKLLQNIESAVVFDIGANIGNHSISISNHCKTIHAFEPEPEIYSNLNKNIKLNNINNINSNKIGLSNAEGKQEFYVNLTGNVGASTLHPDNNTNQYKKIQIELTTGDSFVRYNEITKIDIIKIDIEGHEIQALGGMKASIELFKPIILMEWTANNTISSSDDNSFFNKIRQTHKAYTAVSALEKSLWPLSLAGKAHRYLNKISGKEAWYLVEADLSKKHSNIFLVPDEKLDIIAPLLKNDQGTQQRFSQ